jgi:hypothetical protein
MIKIIFITFIFLLTAQSLFEESKFTTEISNSEDLQRVIFGVYDHVSVVLFWNEECEKCGLVEPIFE